MRELINIVVEAELEERLLPTSRIVKAEWKVETYRKDTGEVLVSKDCETNEEAWELAKGFRHGAGAKIGIRITDIAHTTITSKKIHKIL